MKTTKAHWPGTLIDQRPISRAQLDRLDRLNWQASPERYARRVWQEIQQLAAGGHS